MSDGPVNGRHHAEPRHGDLRPGDLRPGARKHGELGHGEPGHGERDARRADIGALAIAAGLFCFGAVIIVDAMQLADLGGYSQVGPGTVPEIVGGVLILLAIWTVVAAFRHDFPERERVEAPPLLWVVGGLVAQILLLIPAGFSIATGVMFGATARGFGYRNLIFAVIVGVVLSFAVWLLFSQLLQLHLPEGVLENLFLRAIR
ncbi:C4-dicarboxylate ABC transporter [Haematobacter missouriensis]|uniref:Tripartite tricarboxylate transporter TctB family protein n=1 Tax=Haematobacter missouriensis TaxID=366616 RepID=A0A212AJB5_9RHOB|nr:tripartite tricarboxylate transporter TctB family protein [Haematobacter missouriensis]KFI32994.1 C4-dicarboxylate ABC transporter [Haematobacter missouriensis]OWJ74135.1 tripartite tricarboxylate transporter TctB family protein [Haematobacter missouriensis]OWJ81505.1 tripartite tricarboxylate transporter TctB family protein [Haematobacter missouriensis]